jgi:hypothetical protein
MPATAQSPTADGLLAGFDQADLDRWEAEAGAAEEAAAAHPPMLAAGLDETDVARSEAELGVSEERAARVAEVRNRRWAEYNGVVLEDIEIERQAAEEDAAEEAALREDPEYWIPISDLLFGRDEYERRHVAATRPHGRRLPLRSPVPLDGRRRRGTSRAARRSSGVRGRLQRARAPDPDEPDDVGRGPARAGQSRRGPEEGDLVGLSLQDVAVRVGLIASAIEVEDSDRAYSLALDLFAELLGILIFDVPPEDVDLAEWLALEAADKANGGGS